MGSVFSSYVAWAPFSPEKSPRRVKAESSSPRVSGYVEGACDPTRFSGYVEAAIAPARFSGYVEAEIAPARFPGYVEAEISPSRFSGYTEAACAPPRFSGRVEAAVAPTWFAGYVEAAITLDLFPGNGDAASALARHSGYVGVTIDPTRLVWFVETEIATARLAGRVGAASTPEWFSWYVSQPAHAMLTPPVEAGDETTRASGKGPRPSTGPNRYGELRGYAANQEFVQTAPFLRGSTAAYNRAHCPIIPYMGLCAGNLGVVGWATSSGRNCLIHTPAQLAFSAPDVPATRKYTGFCRYIRGMIESDFACEPSAQLDCVLCWRNILLLMGLSPAEYRVCVFRYAEDDCVVLGSGVRDLGVWYAMGHFAPLCRAPSMRKYPPVACEYVHRVSYW